MIRALINLFAQPKGPSPLALARRERKASAEAYAHALQRGDTRDQHWALRRYERATRELLHQERVEGLR